MQQPGVLTRDVALAGDLFEQRDAAIDRPLELFLLGADRAADHLPTLNDLGVRPAKHLDHRRNKFVDEGTVHPEHAPKSGCSSQDSLEHVALTGRPRHDPVSDRDRHAANVICNRPKGEVLVRILLVLLAGHRLDRTNHRREQVRIIIRGDALEDRDDSLQSHSGIDVFGR